MALPPSSQRSLKRVLQGKKMGTINALRLQLKSGAITPEEHDAAVAKARADFDAGCEYVDEHRELPPGVNRRAASASVIGKDGRKVGLIRQGGISLNFASGIPHPRTTQLCELPHPSDLLPIIQPCVLTQAFLPSNARSRGSLPPRS